MARDCAKHAKVVPFSLAALAALGGIVAPATAVADPLPYGPDTCIQGFVWREAQPGDAVCVTSAVRSSTAEENQLASQRVEPNGGAYGPDTCKSGYVWREAVGNDHVCVTPGSRSQAASDNAAAASRKAANAPAAAPAGQEPVPCMQLPGLLGAGPMIGNC